MPTLTIADYLKYANLQMAAEAFIRDERTGILAVTPEAVVARLIAGNDRSLLFTETQATVFAAQWEVLDQKANTTTGFSGTLFRNRANPNELVLSFRSTEFIDDHARDNKATNELEIAEGGFALGQIADMEAWYAELLSKPNALTGNQPPLLGQTYSVTGYSLGGHLATAFNLLRQEELQSGTPAATLDQVVTFNGAGVGQIGSGSLRAMVQRFNELRAQGATADGLVSLFQTQTGWDAYRALNTAISANAGVVTSTMRDTAATVFGTDFLDKPMLEADSKLLLAAIDRALAIAQVAQDVPSLSSGSASSASPKLVENAKILAEDIDYQLAVLTARKEFDTRVRSLVGGAAQLIATGGLSKLPGTSALANQYDAVGWEYSAGNPVAVVAHSLWHHGTDVKLFIEDQPNWRGGIALASLSATLAAADVRLLVNGFSSKDFGDDHSLTLIVDSLNVQNTLLQLLPEAQRGTAIEALNVILKNASWRKGINGDLAFGSSQGQAEGDVLENIVNALADLILGPQIKADRLNGSGEGNTWWDTTNQTVGDTTHTGRDRFYAKLKAITDSTIYKDKLANKLALTPVTGTAATLAENAREDFGTFAALYSLSPFVLRMTDGTALDAALQGATPQENPWGATFSQWQEDRAKVLLGAERGTLNFSQEWYDDRAEFLKRKTAFNAANLDPYNPDAQEGSGEGATVKLADVYYQDMASGYRIQQGRLEGSAVRKSIFGDETDNPDIAGGNQTDHLYGGAGNDSLTGNYGDDLLDGGAGNDTLDGGDGFDTYRVGKGATDRDTIVDGDGKGIIKDAAGRSVAGVFVAREGGGYALLGNPDVTAIKEGADLAITLQGGTQQVVLANFDNTPGGMLGIHLFDVPPAPEIALTPLKGDLQPIDGDLTTPDVVDLTFDGRGNVNVSLAPAPDRDDTLFGSDGNDLIQAGGGNDSVSGKGGSDRIEAGEGSDGVRAGTGLDVVIGGSGSDILRGESGADILHGDAEWTQVQAAAEGETQIATGLRGDLLDGGVDDDIAIGTAGNDLLLGGAGHDLLIGGAGDDALSGDQYLDSEPGSSWSLGVAPDFLRSPDVAVADAVTDEQGADALFGGAGRDLLAGMGGDDYLDGGSGNDILWAGIGNDIAIGGAGSDVIGGADGNDALHGDDTGPLADIGGTDARGDLIDGGKGNDLLTGSVAKDALLGGDGTDTLAGGAGDDLLVGDASISGDVVDSWEVALTVTPTGNGSDYRYTLNGVTGLDDGEGFSGADSLYGGAGADWLLGNGGSDFLDGGSGDDVLFGGANDDTLIGGKGNDVLVGGAGRDTYHFHQGDGKETIIDDNPGGSDASILIFGKGIAKEGIKLRKGSLLLDLGDNDAIHIENFDAENPLATQSFASFQFADGSSLSWGEMLAKGFDLDGTDGDDSIEGTGVADRIDGRAGNDLIWGLAGDDVITGGTGTDGMNGGLGDDTYVFNAGDGATLASPNGVQTETLVDDGGLDTVQFSSTVVPQNLLVRDNLDGSLLIDYHAQDAQPGQPIDRLLVVGGLDGSIERIKVGAGETARTLDYAQLAGEFGSGVLRGSDAQGRAVVAGGKTDDFIVVGGNSARVSSGQGNDSLLLTGANATLAVYRGDGVDRLDAPGANATLRFADQSAADLVFTRAGDDLVIGNAAGDALTIAGWLAGDGLAAGLQTIEFAPSTGSGQAGATWNGEAIRTALLAGTSGNDHLIGYATADVIDGGAGNDVLDGRGGGDSLTGGAGDDLLTGGTGNDLLAGGEGVDVYLLGSGFGADTVVDGGAGTNILRFESWQSPDNLRAARDGADLKLLVRGSADAVTVKDYYAEGGAPQDWRIDFEGANGIALTDFLARPDDAATAISSLWADMKADHTLRSIQDGQLQGWTYLGNLAFDDTQLHGPLSRADVTHQTTTTTRYAVTDYGNTLQRTLLSSDTEVIDDTRITDWGLGGTNPSRARHHLTTDRVDSNAALIVHDSPSHEETLAGAALATLAWQGALTNYRHATWNTVSYTANSGGGPDLEIHTDYELESYERAALVTTYTDNLAGWTAPPGQVVGNRATVNYRQRDSYVPMTSEIVGGDAANEIHAASGAQEFVDGGAGNDTIYGGSVTSLMGARSYPGDLLYGNSGDDAIHGDGAVMAGGDGSDRLYGGFLGDRYVTLSADEAGTDLIEDRGTNAGAFQSWYYQQSGTSQSEYWQVRRVYEGLESWLTFYSQVQAEHYLADTGYAGDVNDALALGDLRYFAGPEAPLLGDSKDYRLLESGGFNTHQDVVQLPEGIVQADLSFAWGSNTDESGTTRATLDVTWHGALKLRIVMPRAADPIGFGIDYLTLGDGNMLGMSSMIDLAPPMPDMGDGTLLGNWQGNTLTAVAGGGHLFGMSGDDTLTGSSSADVITGGYGKDLLNGGAGNDLYVFRRADGQDRIEDHDNAPGNVDTVLFAAWVSPTDVMVSRQGTDVVLSLRGTNDGLTLAHWAEGRGRRIEQVKFLDGTTWDTTTLAGKAGVDLDAREIIDGFEAGDVLVGTSAGEDIYGFGGDDTLNGGAGDDVLNGGPGDDVYCFARGDGHDVVVQDSALHGDVDVIRFDAGIPPADVAVSLGDNGEDLVLTLVDSDDSLTLPNWLYPAGARVSAVEFAGGVAWDAPTLAGKLGVALPGEYIVGTEDGQTLVGTDGDDWIEAFGGNDTITGGQGDDLLDGGAGNDVYRFARGDGQDVVVQDNSMPGDVDVIRFEAGIAPADLLVSIGEAGDGIVLTVGDTGDSLTLPNWFYPSGQRLSAVEFADGGAWDKAALLSRLAPSAGTDGDDLLVSTAAHHVLDGGAGDDTYFVTADTPNTQIVDEGGTDTLLLDDIKLADISLGVGSLKITVNATGQEIHLEDFDPDNPYAEGGIEYFRFADGTYLTKADLIDALGLHPTGTSGDDALSGTSLDDAIMGLAGNDTLDGRGGSDILDGGSGDDTYLHAQGDGVDRIADAAGADRLAFGPGILASEVVASLDGGEVVLSLADSDSIRFAAQGPGSYAIEHVAFDDGTLWQGANLLRQLSRTPPTVAVPVADQAAVEDAVFEFTVPAESFADADAVAGDTLVYASRLGDGSPLPGWLAFDTATRTFSGTPGNPDVGALIIELAATDGAGNSVSQMFGLTVANTNDAPTASGVIADQVATEGAPIGFAIPEDLFADVDVGDSLAYAATLSDGAPFPEWLSFDAATRCFSGIPPTAAVGSLSVRVTATDLEGESASSSFTLSVASSNHAPVLATAIGDLSATQDLAFDYTVPEGTFADSDPGDSLSFTATLSDGTALPTWLGFDTATATFSGTPGAADPGVLALRVTATDRGGLSAQADFKLAVGQHLRGTGSSDTMNHSASHFVGVPLIDGEAGNDTVMGSAGNDILLGGAGTDKLSGGGGDDTFLLSADGTWRAGFVCRNDGSPGHAGTLATVSIAGRIASWDAMHGGSGSDLLVGTAGNDIIVLDDAYSPSPNGLQPRLAGIETIRTGAGDDVVDLTSSRWGYGDVSVAGEAGNDVLWTSSGNDTLLGGAGNDTLDGGFGPDGMAGGAGNDLYVVDDVGDAVIENHDEGTDTVQSRISYVLPDNVENLTLTGAAAINGSGNALDNLLTGTTGNNTLTGNAGNDTLDGKAGTDLLIGSGGDDRLAGGTGSDTYRMGWGDGGDTIVENDATLGNADVAEFLAGIATDQIWFRHVGNSLEASVIGTSDKLTVQNWYLGEQYRVEQFRTADNKLLIDSRVELLVQAMAAFAPPAAGQTTLPPTYQDVLAPVIAANWQ